MSLNWTGKYAQEFVTLFELYGGNPYIFEKKFRKKYQQMFGHAYTNHYTAAKVAYKRHSTIRRFLNYKRKNLCDLSNDFKLFGVWLMRRESITKVRTSTGFWAILDANNEPLSDWDEDSDDETELMNINNNSKQNNTNNNRNDNNDNNINTNNDNNNNFLHRRRLYVGNNNSNNKKRKLNSKHNFHSLLNNGISNNNNNNNNNFIDITEQSDDISEFKNNNNVNINTNLNKRKHNKTNIKGVNGINDALKELSRISPTLNNIIQTGINEGLVNLKTGNKKNKTTKLMNQTLLRLQ